MYYLNDFIKNLKFRDNFLNHKNKANSPNHLWQPQLLLDICQLDLVIWAYVMWLPNSFFPGILYLIITDKLPMSNCHIENR